MGQVSPDYFPSRVNVHVPSMTYSSEVDAKGIGEVNIPAAAALDADGILATTSIATAVTVTDFAATYTADKELAMSKYGRNVTVVSDGAATSTVTINGYDYLGQYMTEVLTLNGTTPVVGVKAFREIASIVAAATASRSITVGWGNALGLPYKANALMSELVSGAIPSNAGALVAGNDSAPTATNADTRGTYQPHASFVPNGTRTYSLLIRHDRDDLHGAVQYST